MIEFEQLSRDNLITGLLDHLAFLAYAGTPDTILTHGDGGRSVGDAANYSTGQSPALF